MRFFITIVYFLTLLKGAFLEERKKIKIGVTLPFKDELWEFYGKQFELKKDENMEIEVTYSYKSVSIQQADSERFIASGIDVLIIAAQDSKSPKNIVEYCNLLGVKVISFIRKIDNIKVAAYIAPDNYQAGVLQGEFINERRKILGDSIPNGLIILSGPKTDKNSFDFFAGVSKTYELSKFEGIGDKVFYVDDWSADFARKLAQNFTEEEKNKIGYVIAANDDIALGFYEGLNKTNYVIASHDNTHLKVQKLCEYLGENFMTVDLDQTISVEKTIAAARLLAENKPISFNNIEDNGTVKQPTIRHKVIKKYCDPK